MKTTAKLLLLLPIFVSAPAALAAASDLAVTADIGATRQSGDGESGNAASFSAGVSYQITPNWSVLLNYTDSGEADLLSISDTFVGGNVVYDATLSLDSSAVGLFAQYLTERQVEHWSFGGRLGLVRWDADVNVTVHASPDIGLAVASDKGTDLAAGLLAQYALTEKWDLTLGLDSMRYTISFDGESTDVTNTRLYIGLKNSF
ncbi:outer membrane beta-barrel protein [Rheinheimera soli]|uniref:outer membrane beta-barrel protein n=1 Tax=Rheinheimera soli TaxID=443616 RepID=UPI001E37B723|nr:outer membrane beta-barrel protein [Rheinheimera soli]